MLLTWPPLDSFGSGFFFPLSVSNRSPSTLLPHTTAPPLSSFYFLWTNLLPIPGFLFFIFSLFSPSPVFVFLDLLSSLHLNFSFNSATFKQTVFPLYSFFLWSLPFAGLFLRPFRSFLSYLHLRSVFVSLGLNFFS